MNPRLHPSPVPLAFALALLGLPLGLAAPAQEAAPNAKDLSARLCAGVLDGTSIARLRMEIAPAGGAPATVLQLQIKARRTPAASEVICQVLWPKERKGESVLVRKPAGQAASGAVLVPPAPPRPLSPSQMQEGLLGGDLAYIDLVDNFFAWEHQTIVGSEIVDRVPCHVLESRPGKADRSPYGRVRSWIDARRLVPMRVEKYLASGRLARTIETTRVAEDDTDRPVAASLAVRRSGHGSVTELAGSNKRHDAAFSDADFTPEALRSLAAPRSPSE